MDDAVKRMHLVLVPLHTTEGWWKATRTNYLRK